MCEPKDRLDESQSGLRSIQPAQQIREGVRSYKEVGRVILEQRFLSPCEFGYHIIEANACCICCRWESDIKRDPLRWLSWQRKLGEPYEWPEEHHAK